MLVCWAVFNILENIFKVNKWSYYEKRDNLTSSIIIKKLSAIPIDVPYDIVFSYGVNCVQTYHKRFKFSWKKAIKHGILV